MFLANVLVEGAGTHALGERSGAGFLERAFLGNLVEEAHANLPSLPGGRRRWRMAS